MESADYSELVWMLVPRWLDLASEMEWATQTELARLLVPRLSVAPSEQDLGLSLATAWAPLTELDWIHHKQWQSHHQCRWLSPLRCRRS